MKTVIAIDSFKGSLSSMEAGSAIATGILRAIPDADILIRPLADGGEGTVEALICGMNGTIQEINVTGPLGHTVPASYGIITETQTAVIEISAAAGITLVPEEKRNPLYTTTYGVGEIIKDAIFKGCRKFLIGIGGSATNDGGVGMLQALGFDFTDQKGAPIPHGACGLQYLTAISAKNAMPELMECEFQIACDVTNPLCGEYGCSAVFGPQKGADPDTILMMDQWLSHYASLAQKLYPHTDSCYEGAGAAGGLGFAFLTFTNAILSPGIQIILKETKLRQYIKDADIVITGEGRLDGQTIMGKAPIGVAALAKEYQKTVIAFSGSVTPEAAVCNFHGIDAFFPILRSITTLEEAMKKEKAAENLAAASEQVFRFYQTIIKK